MSQKINKKIKFWQYEKLYLCKNIKSKVMQFDFYLEFAQIRNGNGTFGNQIMIK